MEGVLIQTRFGVKERYYCIHCNWIGFNVEILQDLNSSRSHEVCPKCGWVCYSESDVRNDYPHAGPYKILHRKFAKIHKRNYEKDLEDWYK